MSVLNDKELKLYEAAKASLPRWMFSDDANSQEVLAAFAKQLGKTWEQVDAWVDQIYITRAFGFFLDQHAIDRGTRRRYQEPDVLLSQRIRTYEDAVTKPALQSTADALLAAAGLGTAHIVELRMDKAFLGTQGAAEPHPGRGRTYLSRGYRMSTTGENALVIILPYGTSDATAAAVAEAVRQKKAGGIIVYVERRLNP